MCCFFESNSYRISLVSRCNQIWNTPKFFVIPNDYFFYPSTPLISEPYVSFSKLKISFFCGSFISRANTESCSQTVLIRTLSRALSSSGISFSLVSLCLPFYLSLSHTDWWSTISSRPRERIWCCSWDDTTIWKKGEKCANRKEEKGREIKSRDSRDKHDEDVHSWMPERTGGLLSSPLRFQSPENRNRPTISHS